MPIGRCVRPPYRESRISLAQACVFNTEPDYFISCDTLASFLHSNLQPSLTSINKPKPTFNGSSSIGKDEGVTTETDKAPANEVSEKKTKPSRLVLYLIPVFVVLAVITVIAIYVRRRRPLRLRTAKERSRALSDSLQLHLGEDFYRTLRQEREQSISKPERYSPYLADYYINFYLGSINSNLTYFSEYAEEAVENNCLGRIVHFKYHQVCHYLKKLNEDCRALKSWAADVDLDCITTLCNAAEAYFDKKMNRAEIFVDEINQLRCALLTARLKLRNYRHSNPIEPPSEPDEPISDVCIDGSLSPEDHTTLTRLLMSDEFAYGAVLRNNQRIPHETARKIVYALDRFRLYVHDHERYLIFPFYHDVFHSWIYQHLEDILEDLAGYNTYAAFDSLFELCESVRKEKGSALRVDLKDFIVALKEAIWLAREMIRIQPRTQLDEPIPLQMTFDNRWLEHNRKYLHTYGGPSFLKSQKGNCCPPLVRVD